MDQSGDVQSLVAAQIRAELQHADTVDSRRARLPCSNRRGHATLHGGAAKGHRLEDANLPGRRPLGPQTAEPATVVQHDSRLDRQIPATLIARDGVMAGALMSWISGAENLSEPCCRRSSE